MENFCSWTEIDSKKGHNMDVATFFSGAVVVAQLEERSLPNSEDPGSNPVIGTFY